MKYMVKLEKTDEGYAVWCPGLPGCWSQGATEEEALENIKDAIETYLATVEELLKDKTTCLVEVARKKTKVMAAIEIERMLTLVPQLLEIPHSRIWTTYDKDADVLYVNFKKPSHADDSKITDDDVIVRYEAGQIVGITILNASKRVS